ncbi:ISAs1 family transposase [Saccharopolyspora hattusasensis]|uniref:ISAs1 family transposase n=1 Tax=Saccharopolyspora hattusasensis TaxID=1128679 RepID=UPI003D9706FE
MEIAKNQTPEEGHPLSFSHSSSWASFPGSADGDDADLAELMKLLGKVPDRRKRKGRVYSLAFLLAASLIAVLAGASNFRQIADQVADLPASLLRKIGGRWCWFRGFFRVPDTSTIRRALENVDVAKLEGLIGPWLLRHARPIPGGTLRLAIDGKVLRGSWIGDHESFTLFSAMIHCDGVTVAQVAVPSGTNEITQVKTLLDGVSRGVDGRVVVTMDAVHTQRETAEYIAGERGFDYVMTVKGNQAALKKKIYDRTLPFLRKTPHHVVVDDTHGRIRRWTTWITDADGIDFPHARSVACVKREETTLSGELVSKEHAWIITSQNTTTVTAEDLHDQVRDHWGIENKSHHVRDTTYHEDAQQIYTGTGAHILATLRNTAISMLRITGHNDIRRTTEWISRDRTRTLPVLSLQVAGRNTQ